MANNQNMFSFWPQLLIIVSLTGIIIILLRRVPKGKGTSFGLISSALWKFLRRAGAELWHFVLEVKGLTKTSTIASQSLLEKFRRARINLPKPQFQLFKSRNQANNYLSSAEADMSREDFAEAERKLIKAIEGDPKDEAAYAALARLYLQMKRFEDASETYKFLLKQRGDKDVYWSNLGQAYHGQKLYSKAQEAYERAIELDPEDAKRYVNLGLTLEAQKHLEEAILNYRKALALEKSNTHFMLILAEALAKIQDREEAEALLEQILLLEPTNHLAREKLMQLKF